MTALTLMEKIRRAEPQANVFVKAGDRFFRVDDVVLSGVDPVIAGLTTVTLQGEPLGDESERKING